MPPQPQTSVQPQSAKSPEDIRKKILAGNRARTEAARQQREYNKERREEEEEEKARKRGDISMLLPNIIIAIIFVSLPLTEKEIDWLQVLVFTGTNGVWAVFFHYNTWMHFTTIILLNLLCVQVAPEIRRAPELIAAIPPVTGTVFLVLNGVFGAAGYFGYVDKAKTRRIREHRIDMLSFGMMLINIAALVYIGTIPLTLLYHMFKTLTHIVGQ
jgi:hypothetical protein